MSELKRCPFCGSEANIVGGPEDWHPTSYDPDSGGDPYSVVCTGCECGMALAFWDSDEAIAAWNRRADHSGEANGMVNVPLTLEELRGMDGEPVYIVYPNAPELDGWQVLKGVDGAPDEDGNMYAWFTDDMWHTEDYGDGWLAYRQKPEGGVG